MKLMLYKSSTIVDPDSLKYKEFKDLYKEDKEKGGKCLLFVFLLCDLSEDNPIRDIKYTERPSEARLLAFGNKSFDILKEYGDRLYALTQKAITCYKSNIVKDEEKDIETYNNKMDQFGEMLDSTDPEIIENVSELGLYSYTTNIDIINSVLKDIVTIINNKSQMISMMVKGTVPKTLRGGLSPLAKGKIDTVTSKKKTK
jgi:hypothetical protein